MATYSEIRALFNHADLRNRIEVAVVKAATVIAVSSTETAPRTAWAKQALRNPSGEADGALMVALAANSGLTVAQITGASDATLQTAVDSAVNVLSA